MGPKILVVLGAMSCATPAWAAVCQTAWDGDKLMANIASQPAVGVVPLRDKNGTVTEIGADRGSDRRLQAPRQAQRLVRHAHAR